jgi:hypothetical protein
MIHVPTCGQRIIIVLKIVITTPQTLKLNLHLLRRTPVSEWSQILLNEILKHKHFSSLNHNTSSIAGLIKTGADFNNVIYSLTTKVFHEFLSSFVLVNYGRSVKAF